MTTARTMLRTQLARVVTNSASLLTTDVLNKATTFVVYALVARYTDTREFGQLSLGLLLLYTFQVFACVGLPTLVTRDLALDRSLTPKYFSNANAVVTATSVLASLGMWGFAWLMQYSADTRLVILILAVGLVPLALASVTEAVFRAWERMHYIAYANVPANLLKVGLAYVILRQGYGVVAIATMLVGCRVVILVAEWVMFVAAIERPHFKVEWHRAKDLLVRGSTFLGIDGLVAIWNSLDVVLISKLCGESDVGLYSAACQLLIPARLFFQSIVSSVFPIMCRKVKLDLVHLARFVPWLVEFLMMIGLPIAVGVFFLAGPCLLLLYGDPSFVQAAGVVRILVAALFFQTMISVFGHALWAGWRERVTLRIIAVNLVVNLALGLVLIYYFGILGAAVASLTTCLVNALQHYLAATHLLGPLPILRTAWKPVTAAAAMAGCFAMFQSAGDVVASIVSALTYVSVLGVLVVHAAGGLDEFRSAYFSPLLNEQP
jgi:O-antigen/teichoic acid export membrane protein